MDNNLLEKLSMDCHNGINQAIGNRINIPKTARMDGNDIVFGVRRISFYNMSDERVKKIVANVGRIEFVLIING